MDNKIASYHKLLIVTKTSSYLLPVNSITDIRCDNSSIENGNASCTSGKVGVGYIGDTCNFTCNTGYELIGNDTRTCQSDGSWSGSDNLCVRGTLYLHS